MIDVDHQINAVRRTVGRRTLEAGEAHVVTVSQAYDTTVEDLWDCCTNAERLPRWFLPVTGELRVGGRYQLEGNAGGEILECEPPHRLAATWEYGDAVSWIEVAVTPEGDGARVTLEHLARPDEHWGQFGPGAVGIGWDLAVVGLTLHLETGVPVDAAEVQAWTISPDGLRFMTDAGTAWGEADAARGEDPEVARRGRRAHHRRVHDSPRGLSEPPSGRRRAHLRPHETEGVTAVAARSAWVLALNEDPKEVLTVVHMGNRLVRLWELKKFTEWSPAIGQGPHEQAARVDRILDALDVFLIPTNKVGTAAPWLKLRSKITSYIIVSVTSAVGGRPLGCRPGWWRRSSHTTAGHLFGRGRPASPGTPRSARARTHTRANRLRTGNRRGGPSSRLVRPAPL